MGALIAERLVAAGVDVAALSEAVQAEVPSPPPSPRAVSPSCPMKPKEREREREREWDLWWTHTGGGKALAFEPPPNVTSGDITS